MKKIKTAGNVVLLFVICASLNSCLSVDRKIKINTDGSGEETMTVTFHKEFYKMIGSMTSMMDSAGKSRFLDSLYSDEIFVNKTRSKYDSVPGIKIMDIHSQKNQDSSNSFIVKYSFDSISKIGSSLDFAFDNDEKGRAPTYVTMTKDGDEMVFNYLYEKEGPDELSDNDSLSGAMLGGIAKMFETGYINFQIEFPYEVISSNATTTDQNTLNWNYPMSEVFMKTKIILEARMKH